MKSEKRFYVYVHRRKTDGSIFYVGKGTGTRIHSNSSRNRHWHNVNNKHGRTSEIIRSFLTCDEACQLEKEIISEIGIDNLCNKSIGGDSGASGTKHTEEWKKNMAAFMRKEGKRRSSDPNYVNPLKGVPISEHVRVKISLGHIKRWENISEEDRMIWLSKVKEGVNKPCNIKRLSIRNTGHKNPSYDNAIYSFLHESGEIYMGTQYDFYKKYGLLQGNVSSICTGRRKRTKGWRIKNEIP